MRVLQVTPGYPPSAGGVEQHVQRLGAALVERGHQVGVLSADGGPEACVDEPGPDGVSVVRLPSRTVGPFLLTRGLSAALCDVAESYDVVHVHNYHSPLPLAVLRQALSVPVVVTPHFHGGGHSRAAQVAHLVYAPLARRMFGRAQAAVCVSAAEAAAFTAAVPSLSGRVRVIPNGVRTVRPGPPLGERGRLVMSVSRLERYKRVDHLVRAIALLPGLRCVIVGDGPERSALQKLASDLGVLERITFAGRVSDDTLERLLGSAACTVQPSAHEAFGMAVLEAVAAGSRVVASDIPAHREVAAMAGEAATLWAPETGAAGLAHAITYALSAGLPLVPPQLPTWEQAAREVETVYVRVVTDTWPDLPGPRRPDRSRGGSSGAPTTGADHGDVA